MVMVGDISIAEIFESNRCEEQAPAIVRRWMSWQDVFCKEVATTVNVLRGGQLSKRDLLYFPAKRGNSRPGVLSPTKVTLAA